MTPDHLASLRRLERQYLCADRLLLKLAARADLSSLWTTWTSRNRAHRAIASASFASAYSLLNRWVNTQNELQGEVRTQVRTAIAFAIAAIDLAHPLPELSAAFGQPWNEALKAGAQLRTLGEAAERAALALAPTWRLDLPAPVAAAVAVTHPSHRKEPELRPHDYSE